MSSCPTSSSLGHEERLWLWQKKKCELVGMFDTVEVKISIFKVGTDNLKLSSCRYRSTQRQPDRFLFASELRRPTTREKNVGLLTRLVSNGAILPSFSISCLVAEQNDTVSVKFMNLKADDVFILSPSVVSSQWYIESGNPVVCQLRLRLDNHSALLLIGSPASPAAGRVLQPLQRPLDSLNSDRFLRTW